MVRSAVLIRKWSFGASVSLLLSLGRRRARAMDAGRVGLCRWKDGTVAKRLTDQDHIWRSVPESDVVRSVLDYIQRRGGYAWRQNVGGSTYRSKSGQEYFVRFAEKGASDVVAICGGVVLWIECKTEIGKQRDEQRAWQANIEAVGGRYLIARPSTWQAVIDAALET